MDRPDAKASGLFVLVGRYALLVAVYSNEAGHFLLLLLP